MLDLDAIKKLCDHATPGPWEPKFCSCGCCAYLAPKDIMYASNNLAVMSPADASFMASSRELVPALVAELEKLKQSMKDIGPTEQTTGRGQVMLDLNFLLIRNSRAICAVETDDELASHSRELIMLLTDALEQLKAELEAARKVEISHEL